MSKELIDEVIEKMKETASQASKEYNKSDDENHSFMLGYIMSSFGHLLRDLELSETQLKLLEEFN
jgi:mevalonate kinase